jgi:4-amino-4-deoxy-L-arabinose transferase-like glycosyltransferase
MAERGAARPWFPLSGAGRWGLALAGVTLLALAARFWQINYHSLWFDEAMSVFWARRPAGEIWRVGLSLVLDKHPPVYYFLLHLWMALFGDGEVALRALSALLGALTPLALALLGAELGSRRAGLIAGLLAAFNPMLVWYSQEVRMFGPATTLAVLATLCLARALRSQTCEVSKTSQVYLFGFVLLILAGVYCYLFIALLLPFQGLWALIVWAGERPRSGRRLLTLLAAFAVVAAGFAPLALRALTVGGAEALPGQPFAGLGANLAGLLTAYTLRQTPWPAGNQGIATLCAGLLWLGGLLAAPGRGRWLLGLWLALPLLAGNLLLALDGTVFAETRYFVFLAPALCLGWGFALAGVAGRKRLAGLALLAGWTLLTLAALPQLWTPAQRREDWRATAQYAATHAGPQDAILVHPAFVAPAFQYYYAGPAPVFRPFEGAVDETTDLDGPLSGLAGGYATVWLVASHDAQPDPARRVRAWLEARYPLATEQYPAGVTLRSYITRYRLAELPAGATPLEARYAGGLRLVGYALDARRLPAGDDRYHPPSHWIHATLYWQTEAELTRDFTAQLHLVDALGQVWGAELARANDTLGLWPAARWVPGEIVRHDVDVNLNPATPAGRYRLELVVLDKDGAAWPPADAAALGEIEITAR